MDADIRDISHDDETYLRIKSRSGISVVEPSGTIAY